MKVITAADQMAPTNHVRRPSIRIYKQD